MMHLCLFDRPFVLLTLMAKSWELCPSNKVPDCHQTSASNILRIKEKGNQIGVSECRQGLTRKQNVS
jgi:hypothetical protein